MITQFQFLSTWLKARFGASDRGASLVEYALLVALIAVVAIAAVNLIGDEASETFNNVGGSLSSVNDEGGATTGG